MSPLFSLLVKACLTAAQEYCTQKYIQGVQGDSLTINNTKTFQGKATSTCFLKECWQITFRVSQTQKQILRRQDGGGGKWGRESKYDKILTLKQSG